jgi:hypothetical protein
MDTWSDLRAKDKLTGNFPRLMFTVQGQFCMLAILPYDRE